MDLFFSIRSHAYVIYTYIHIHIHIWSVPFSSKGASARGTRLASRRKIELDRGLVGKLENLSNERGRHGLFIVDPILSRATDPNSPRATLEGRPTVSEPPKLSALWEPVSRTPRPEFFHPIFIAVPAAPVNRTSTSRWSLPGPTSPLLLPLPFLLRPTLSPFTPSLVHEPSSPRLS